MPNPCGPWNASPESFSRIRLYAGFAFRAGNLLPFFAVIFLALLFAAMRLPWASSKIHGIVTNYLRPRTFGVHLECGSLSRPCRDPAAAFLTSHCTTEETVVRLPAPRCRQGSTLKTGARLPHSNGHRGESHLSSPATPPDMRVRIRRFGGLS